MPTPDSSATTTKISAEHPAASRGRAKKKLGFGDRALNLVERFVWPLALLTGVVGIVYWYWTTTPQYALAAVVMSINNHDTRTFEKYVDVDSIAGRAFDTIVDGPARTAIMGRYDSMIGVGFLRFFKNDLVGVAHDKVVGFVENNHSRLEFGKNAGSWLTLPNSGVSSESSNRVVMSPNAANAEPLLPDAAEETGQHGNQAVIPTSHHSAIPPLDTPASDVSSKHDSALFETAGLSGKVKQQLSDYGLSKNGFRSANLHLEGSVALLDLQFYSPKLKQNWLAQFKLEDAGGYWRVTELSNLNQLVDKYMLLHQQHLI